MEWISVKDRLPSSNYVLVYFKESKLINQSEMVAYYDCEEQSWSSVGGWINCCEITHWMPLPKPPKK